MDEPWEITPFKLNIEYFQSLLPAFSYISLKHKGDVSIKIPSEIDYKKFEKIGFEKWEKVDDPEILVFRKT